MNKHKLYATLCSKAVLSSTGRVRSDIEYLVEDTEDEIIIAVRGSELDGLLHGGGWKDWLRNLLRFPWYSSACGWAHFGYLKAAKDLSRRIISISAESPQKTVVIVGFSMGAAVACLTALEVDKHWGGVCECVMFGSPRFLYTRPELTFLATSYRFRGDPVTSAHWPLRHPVELTQLGSGSANIFDHNIDKYIAGLTW